MSFVVEYTDGRGTLDIVIKVTCEVHAAEMLACVRLNIPDIVIIEHYYSPIGEAGGELLIDAVLPEDAGLVGLLMKMSTLVPA